MKITLVSSLLLLCTLQVDLCASQAIQQRLAAALSLKQAADHDKLPEQKQVPVHEANTQTADGSDPIPYSTRAFWMRRAVAAIYELTGSPCFFAAFGTAIVNHTAVTDDGLGKLVCIGVNQNAQTGNPTLHGEIAALQNCTTVLSQPPYSLSPAEITHAFRSLSLYTTAEACPMCASSIRWASMAEYVYGSSITYLQRKGWNQFDIPSAEVFARSTGLQTTTRFVGSVLANETDPLFSWQFDGDSKCPRGCERKEGTCHQVVKQKENREL